MGVVVQKYGGSSVADAAGVKRVAQRIADTRRAGNDVVVVVSAQPGPRELLEVPATALAARRREQRHLDALRAAVEREKHSRGRSVKFRDHRHFHGIIIEASGNGLLAMMTEPVFRVLQSRFLNTDTPPEFWTRVDQEHEAIIDRIEAGEVRWAAAGTTKG